METRQLPELAPSRFAGDYARHESTIAESLEGASCLVIGAAGSIGRALVKRLWQSRLRCLHLVDLSENEMVSVVRELRGSGVKGPEHFQTLALDILAPEFKAYMQAAPGFDYVLNLAALKHVRSEKDAFTLMRMLRVNALAQSFLVDLALQKGAKKYFCVSTDKASRPTSLMGASKRLMEFMLLEASARLPVSSARFANVAYSKGSLLDGLEERLRLRQPIAAPSNIYRYFISADEAAQLCLLSLVTADNREIYFPRPDDSLQAVSMLQKVEEFLATAGYQSYPCDSEQQALAAMQSETAKGRWPCLFLPSQSAGEKPLEEFFSEDEHPDFERFHSIGVINRYPDYQLEALLEFRQAVDGLLARASWSKEELIRLIQRAVPSLQHRDTGRSLDEAM